MKKHVNIPIFIPHYGCPNDCVFCNQKKITGKPCYDKDTVIKEIEASLSTINRNTTEVELAFFGGSFTAIPENEMLGLLSISDIFRERGDIRSVRLSTRPDAITPHILEILGMHGVKTIELGLQSFSDKVLLASNRGHSSSQSINACRMIKEFGFTLIGQMMVGLPCSDIEDELYTAKMICHLGCDGARIYPTVVFPETELMRMKESGKYSPLSTDEAIVRTAQVLKVFIDRNVPVIRIGLCSNETLTSPDFDGNYHPSIGELAINRYYLAEMTALLSSKKNLKGKTAIFSVSKGKISQALGQRRSNAECLKAEFGLADVKVKEDDMPKAFMLSVDIR